MQFKTLVLCIHCNLCLNLYNNCTLASSFSYYFICSIYLVTICRVITFIHVSGMLVFVVTFIPSVNTYSWNTILSAYSIWYHRYNIIDNIKISFCWSFILQSVMLVNISACAQRLLLHDRCSDHEILIIPVVECSDDCDDCKNDNL